METWCTVAEAAAITNETLTTGDLVAANQLLEIWVGVTPEARDAVAEKSARNIRLLKKAEAYQAVWMKEKPALFERSDVDQVIQDSLQYTKSDQDSHVLAPLAKAAIQRLSFRGARTIMPLSPAQAAVIRGKFYPEVWGQDLGIGDRGFSDWEDL